MCFLKIRLFASPGKVDYMVFIGFIQFSSFYFLSQSFAWNNFLYKLFFFLIQFAMLFLIQDLLCFLFLLFEYLKGTCISRLLSSSRNCSKKKLTSFRLAFSRDFKSVFNISNLKSSLLKFLQDLLMVTLFGSFFKIFGVIRNCA